MWLTKNLVTVLFFSIINVLCGADGDASFALQANLVLFEQSLKSRYFYCILKNFNLLLIYTKFMFVISDAVFSIKSVKFKTVQ